MCMVKIAVSIEIIFSALHCTINAAILLGLGSNGHLWKCACKIITVSKDVKTGFLTQPVI